MTISLVGQSPKAVTAYHSSIGPGYMLQVGNELTVLSEADADKLGRYLLFDKVETPAESVEPEGEDA